MSVDPSQCPFCGNHNHCALVEDPKAEHCWCQQQSISPALIEQLSPQQRNKSCICEACAIKAQQLSREIL